MSEAQKKPVGYKNPPQHSRFKPGQSGNPKGRPKRVPATTSLAQFLENEIIVLSSGKRIRMTVMEAVVRNIAEQSLRGELKAAKLLFDVAKHLPKIEEKESGVEGGDPGAELRRRFEKIIERRDAVKAMGFDKAS